MASQTCKIAIIGIGAQISSGSFSEQDLDYRTFWDFLLAGGESYQPITPDLFEYSGFPVLDKIQFPAAGAFLKNPSGLDTLEFGISARDARAMPFTARRLMEMSFEALADSGIDYRRRRVGCYMSGVSDFEVQGPPDWDGSFASVPSALPNRISYAFDLTGPSLEVDTACSSSLTALHLAAQAIAGGDCEAALVGAAQINRGPTEWENYVRGGVLSRDGTTKPFDAAADGFGRGEGAIVVVLKSLEDALRDHDHIYSVVTGSAINSTGSHMPLNVPSGIAQQQCIEEAYQRAGRSVLDADYAELHITGTSAGDPIEANTAGEIFAQKDQLVVGSAKGNVGHLESAAFLVSLLKSSLILEHKLIPPTVNFRTPSSAISWDRFSIHVPVVPTPLQSKDGSGHSVISISSAGIGGSTGHVILESPPPRTDLCTATLCNEGNTSSVTFIVGGLSPRAATLISQTLVSSLADADLSSLRRSAVTLARRARQMPWRLSFTLPKATLPQPTLVPAASPPIVFIFSGQGPQHIEMARSLFAEFPLFRKTVLQLDDVFTREMGYSLIESTGLFADIQIPGSARTKLSPDAWPVTITVASIAMLQIALFDLLSSVGVRPAYIAGHSAGETAALYASGAGPKEMAFEIALARGLAMSVTESQDRGMASLACTKDAAARIIGSISPGLEISCLNSTTGVAISGLSADLDEAVRVAQGESVFAQRIRTMVPGHSSFMDPIKADYLARMDSIFERYPGSHVPRIPVYSTCTGERIVREFTAEYFWNNCRNPVLFDSAIGNILRDVPAPVFVEMSCHPVLSSSILTHGIPDNTIVCPMRRASKSKPGPNEHLVFTGTLASLALMGLNSIDLSALYGESDYKPAFAKHPLVNRPILPLKVLPFYDLGARGAGPGEGHLLDPANKSIINEKTHPLLAQHVVSGQPILPATAYLELILEAGANVLWDIEFTSMYSLSETSAPLSLDRSDSKWVLRSTRDHARGMMDESIRSAPPDELDVDEIWSRLPAIDIDGFYESIAANVQFGPAYRRVTRFHGSPSEVIAEIRVPTTENVDVQGWSNQYRLHPILLDACIHILLHPAISKEFPDHGGDMYLPAKLRRFVLYPGVQSETGSWTSHIRRCSWAPDWKSYDIVILDQTGHVICQFDELVVQRLATTRPGEELKRFDLVRQPCSLVVNDNNESVLYHDLPPDDEGMMVYGLLDDLAVGLMKRSLSNGSLVIGQDISRKRYLDYAREYAQRQVGTCVLQKTLSERTRERFAPYFEVTFRLADVHETVFESPQRAIDELYSDDLMARLYSRETQSSRVYDVLPGSLAAILSTIEQQGRRSIKILEVGAGTGLLTRFVVEALKQFPHLLCEYTVSDASFGLASELAQKLDHPNLVPRAYDLTLPPTSQGLTTESFDIVLALHVLHAVPHTKTCLSALETLLIPGGYLLAVEIDGRAWGSETKPGCAWFDCVFGSFPEWLSYDDGRSHCAMSPDDWMTQLGEVGFVNRQVMAETDGRGCSFMFTAQRSRIWGPTPAEHLVQPMPYSIGREMELQSRIAKSASPEEPFELYISASDGPDGEAALGLCNALAREYPLWSIRLVVFASPEQILIPVRLFDQGESVVYVNGAGDASVLRMLPMGAPSARLDIGYLSDDEILASPIAAERIASGLILVAASVMDSHDPGLSSGTIVLALVDQVSKENELCIPAQAAIQIAGVPDHLPRTPKQYVVASKLFGSDVLLPDCDGIDPKTPAPKRHMGGLITDSETLAAHPHLREWITRSAKLIVWDQILRETLHDDPATVAGTLRSAWEGLGCRELTTPAASPLAASDTQPLFSSDKWYILLGGIGGLGADLALWMYQHGARRIALTSRRGIASLSGDEESLAKIAWMQTRGNLELRMDACDATSERALASLTDKLSETHPIGGCIQLTLVLSDATFQSQTAAGFKTVRDSKVGVFDAFSHVVDVHALDFYVAFSSLSGLVGLPGQTNYGSACTELNARLAPYRNAFSLIVPGILNAGTARLLLRHPELWAYLQDGLGKLQAGHVFNQYIPNLDWHAMSVGYPLPSVFKDLVRTKPTVIVSETSSDDDLLARVLTILEVDRPDFDEDRPLISYGLDSLTATRISALLQPFGSVSQLQLLGGISWTSVRGKLSSSKTTPEDVLLEFLGVDKKDFDSSRPLISYNVGFDRVAQLATVLKPYMTVTELQLLSNISWAQLTASGPALDMEQTFVDLLPGEGTPLFVLFGAAGVLGSLLALRTHHHASSGPLYGAQITSATPIDSFTGLAHFLAAAMREKQPHGPYRIAAYSQSCLLAIELVRVLEGGGNVVEHLIFLDHFPAMFTVDKFALLVEDPAAGEQLFYDHTVKTIISMFDNDPLYASTDRGDVWRATVAEGKGPADVMQMLSLTSQLNKPVLEFLSSLALGDDGVRSWSRFLAAFERWVAGTAAQYTLMVAEYGIRSTLAESDTEFRANLGVGRCAKNVDVHFLNGVGHFGVMGSKHLADLISVTLARPLVVARFD
ncbi:unnamed protein product [Mycena citricolor]|uniref:Polyketide synthase n=1 Tax=Mycena citricolor TaxID=2018698 RepID=A0AAD2JXQ8_9AGAR|nr:unnamed protein product [Mycena citricolor]